MRQNNCTWWPESLLGINLSGACTYHDWHYARQQVSRRVADRNLRYRIQGLRLCTQDKCNACPGKYRAFVISWVMWAGVRLFGWIAWRRNKK